MHQAFPPSGPKSLHEPFRLAITHVQQRRRVLDAQFPRDDAPQHRGPRKLSIAHGCPLHSRLLAGGAKLGDSSIGVLRGHYHWRST